MMQGSESEATRLSWQEWLDKEMPDPKLSPGLEARLAALLAADRQTDRLIEAAVYHPGHSEPRRLSYEDLLGYIEQIGRVFLVTVPPDGSAIVLRDIADAMRTSSTLLDTMTLQALASSPQGSIPNEAFAEVGPRVAFALLHAARAYFKGMREADDLCAIVGDRWRAAGALDRS